MEYKTILDRVMHYVDRKADFGRTISVANAKRAVQYAYNAGRQSVADNIPELEWNENAEQERCWADCIGWCYNIYKEPGFGFVCFLIGNKRIGEWYNTMQAAKQAANEDYRRRLKKALGI